MSHLWLKIAHTPWHILKHIWLTQTKLDIRLLQNLEVGIYFGWVKMWLLINYMSWEEKWKYSLSHTIQRHVLNLCHYHNNEAFFGNCPLLKILQFLSKGQWTNNCPTYMPITRYSHILRSDILRLFTFEWFIVDRPLRLLMLGQRPWYVRHVFVCSGSLVNNRVFSRR